MILAAETGDWTGRVEGVGLSETKVLDQFQLPIGHWFDQMVDWMDVNAEWFLNAAVRDSGVIGAGYEGDLKDGRFKGAKKPKKK